MLRNDFGADINADLMLFCAGACFVLLECRVACNTACFRNFIWNSGYYFCNSFKRQNAVKF